MNTSIKHTVFASALIVLATFGVSNQADAQEAAMVYASNVTSTNSLKDVNANVNPKMLAEEYSKELTAELDVRLPQDHAELSEELRIKNDYNDSILQELDVRLKQEIRNLAASVSD